MRTFIIEQLMRFNVNCQKTLEEYVDFCENNKSENGDMHHILPRVLFPEYINLKCNTWNCSILSPDNHYIAHAMLSKCMNEDSLNFAWYAMNNKNFNDNRQLTLIGHEKYNELINKRNRSSSKRMKNKVMAKNILTNEIIQVNKEEFENNDNLVGMTKGTGGEHLKGQVSILENGNPKRILYKDFNPEVHIGLTKGKTTYKDKDGNIFQCAKDDPRVISGELVGINKGNKFKNPSSKGQQIKINVFNENDELMYECYGNYKKICKEYNLPLSLLSDTIKNNSVIEFDFNNKRKCDITKIKRSNNYKFKGWYARKLNRNNI